MVRGHCCGWRGQTAPLEGNRLLRDAGNSQKMTSPDQRPISCKRRGCPARYAALVIVFIALLVMLRGNWVSAQYVPIPNYTGIGAGQQFRNDVNNHLSGVTAVAPRL